jgi:hypothetical protein
MATPDDVMNQLGGPGSPSNPADTITVYDGADPKKNGFAPWRAWDLRGWVRQLTWDLLRFRAIDDGKPNADRTVKLGLWDAVLRTVFQVDRQDEVLKRIAAKIGVDVSDLY